jgi:uncharacterized protein YjbI with pentapeptide repeats
MDKPMTRELREKIQSYRKNHLDISDLIKNVSIKGEDLSYSKIKELYRLNTDISNCNLSHCEIGSDNTTIHIINSKLINCNFESTRFIGTVWMRSCDAQNCNFKNTDIHSVDFRNTNFLGSTFCNAIITIGTRQNIGVIFPPSLLQDLTKGWKNIEVKIKE